MSKLNEALNSATNHNRSRALAHTSLETPNLKSDERGSIAIIFGLSIFVLCGMVAFSVDYSRALAVRSKLQSAVDAAALAADPTGTLPYSKVKDNVNSTFAYNMPADFMLSDNVKVNDPIAIQSGYQVTATADVPMTFGRLLGVDTIPIGALAEAKRSQTNLEIVLVLDNTFSMTQNGKIAAAKTAAKDLVAQIVSASPANTVKFALVPFSNYVNVGVGNRAAYSNWMSIPADWVETINVPGGSYTTTDWAGCPTITQTYSCPQDGVPQTCSYQACATPGPVHTVTYNPYSYTVNHTWKGCAGSRLAAPDLNVTAGFANPVPGILDVDCPSTLARLTTDDTAIKTQIDGMIAVGETYITSGLMWGWRTLAPDSPFADGVAYNSNPRTKKIMILMTDGFNTRSQSGTNHDGTDSVAADKSMEQPTASGASMCENIKATSIELYTIDFEVNNAASKSLLQTCASGFDHYFDAQDSNALIAAFHTIAGSITKLALTK